MSVGSPLASLAGACFALARSHAPMPLVAIGLLSCASREACVHPATVGAGRKASEGEAWRR